MEQNHVEVLGWTRVIAGLLFHSFRTKISRERLLSRAGASFLELLLFSPGSKLRVLALAKEPWSVQGRLSG